MALVSNFRSINSIKMIGQKLFLVLSRLSTAERKFFFLRAKKTEDKRFKQFVFLLGKKGFSTAEFQTSLDIIKKEIATNNSNEKEMQDALRRFIDFCIKEVENLKIELYIKSNFKTRNFILSEIYDHSSSREIHEDYLNKLDKFSDEKDFWLKNYYVTKMSAIKLRSQKLSDLEDWKSLLIKQKKLVQENYQHEIASVYDKISASFIDDKRSIDLLEGELKTEDDLLLQIALAKNDLVKASLYLTLARFFFKNEAKFKEYTNSSLKLLANQSEKEAQIIKRKLHFASFLQSFHFNHSYSETLNHIKQVLEINKKFDLEDDKSVFYLFFLQLLKTDHSGEINVFETGYDAYFSHESTLYLKEFLQAFEFFSTNNYKSAKRLLTNLSYIDNPYLASWARLIEIVTNYKQGNTDFAETLLKSELKRMDSNKNRIFSMNSNLRLLKELSDRLLATTPVLLKTINTEKTKYTLFHQLLSNELKNKN
jgi:hypothetical protein